jgi:formylglycine-generating enzyme required for sulfatase activity
VKVTNDAGSTNSQTAAVTINRPPTIASQPTSQSIETGTTATLTVSATGSAPFTYQWYRGNLGVTTAPVGTNSPSFTTPVLTATTKYWVKISNAFGEVQSNSVTVTVSVNSAPTISDIADQTITEGNNTGALAFTIGDAQTAAGSLTLSGSSSNTTLVPNANIVFGGSGANRTVTVTPTSSQTGTATVTVTVSDGSLSVSDTFLLTVNSAAPTGFALIPQGAFTMGDSLDGMNDAPTRTVTLDAFYMGKHEVTKAEWDEVRTWGLGNGYTDLAAGSGKASNHPVQSITWYDMVKWCNARSQKEGLTPVYYANDAQTTIYKTGNMGVTNAQVRWTANGYRLPTEAEWEKAARGDLSDQRFPWGDTISQSQANYRGNPSYYGYDLGPNGYNSIGSVGGTSPATSPVGSFAANGYGLYDMAGNVCEWCWDRYGLYAAGSQSNPQGSTSGSQRVFRGGAWYVPAESSRVAYRNYTHLTDALDWVGFRVLRSLAP